MNRKQGAGSRGQAAGGRRQVAGILAVAAWAALVIWAAPGPAPGAPGVAKPATRPAAKGYPYANVHPRVLKYPALRFDPPEPVKKTLPNGMTLSLLEDHELPLFNAVAYINVGSIYEPADKVGLGALTGSVMRTGGTDAQTGDEIDEALEFVGGSVEVSIGSEYGTARVSTLQKDADAGMEILAGVLRRPAFPEAKLELAKQRVIEGIRRRDDDPGSVSGRVFAGAVYGEASPWARVPTIAGVRAITRQDLADFHARAFAPGRIYLAVSGDMTTDAMAALVQRWFGDWERKPADLPAVQPVPQSVKPEVILVPKDVSQVNIRLGHLGVRRHSPDQYAVEVLNYVLGTGGFTSRLMREVRSNRGLAYSVWGLVGKGRDRGTFQVIAETKVESTHDAIQVVRDVLEGMVRGPIAPEEVAAAKEALINSYVFTFESRAAIAGETALRDMLGYPADYLETYPRRIAAVTPADVQRAAKTHLHPASLVIVAVGPQGELAAPLADFGAVRILPLKPPE